MPQDNMIETGRGVVDHSMCDRMGHLTTRVYTGLFDDASYKLVEACGLTVDDKTGFADLELKTKFINEIRCDGRFYIKSGFLKLGNSSLVALHHMYNAADDSLISTCEETAVIFDLVKRKSMAMSDEFRKNAQKLMA
ncbi:MAG: thioesterase family protein [Emcibacteraceae bacterium]|nr:thioesterase family protein [Emcibacteraceae bacterium]